MIPQFIALTITPRGHLKNGNSLKLVDRFTELRSNVSSTENNISTWLVKAWTTTDCLSFLWKLDISDKLKYNFFQVAVVSILLYWCATVTLTNCMEKKNLTAFTQKCWELYWTNPGVNTPENFGCTVTYDQSRKPSRLAEQDMQGTVGVVRMNFTRTSKGWTTC